jgi:hypothetical protein
MANSTQRRDFRPIAGALRMWHFLGIRLLSAVVVFVAACVAPPAQSQSVTSANPVAENRDDDVARIVTGIISFTRWPADPPVIRLCVATPAVYADNITARTPANPARQIVNGRYPLGDMHLETDCDVIYVEQGNEAAQRLFQHLAGHPVLSIGGDDDACTMGSLFCLTHARGVLSFAANLDAIARSGLRVNPKVLLLARSSEARK